ncbi:hypothetical protein JOL62DRAFT_390435 [Phyllosticta paracitricarpa]|uniref:Uncharacterized protein n=1 Tax=Phyllosticta paracitricarpa TaxID=2016321 RepID=A0ABR1NI42_9PEZI
MIKEDDEGRWDIGKRTDCPAMVRWVLAGRCLLGQEKYCVSAVTVAACYIHYCTRKTIDICLLAHYSLLMAHLLFPKNKLPFFSTPLSNCLFSFRPPQPSSHRFLPRPCILSPVAGALMQSHGPQADHQGPAWKHPAGVYKIGLGLAVPRRRAVEAAAPAAAPAGMASLGLSWGFSSPLPRAGCHLFRHDSGRLDTAPQSY